MAELCNEIQSAPPLKILKWPFKMPNFESNLEIGSHFDNDFAQLGSSLALMASHGLYTPCHVDMHERS